MRALGIIITCFASISSIIVFVIILVVDQGNGSRPLFGNWHEFEAFANLMMVSVVPLVGGIAMIIWGKR